MWTAPPHELRLEAGDVHVWQADLTIAAPLDDLDERERTRAAKFRFDRDRLRYIAAHAALRRILARYADRAPSELRIEIAEFGKPFLAGPVRFSMSHGGDRALYAVALREVGVDVEQIRESVETLELAQRFLPEEEVRYLLAQPANAQRAAFFRLWTRREAYLKAKGIGLRGISEPIPGSWSVTDLVPANGYAAALACEGSAPAIATWIYR